MSYVPDSVCSMENAFIVIQPVIGGVRQLQAWFRIPFQWEPTLQWVSLCRGAVGANDKNIRMNIIAICANLVNSHLISHSYLCHIVSIYHKSRFGFNWLLENSAEDENKWIRIGLWDGDVGWMHTLVHRDLQGPGHDIKLFMCDEIVPDTSEFCTMATPHII